MTFNGNDATLPAPTPHGEPRRALLGPDDSRWGRFAQAHPEAQVFHDPVWARLLADCYGGTPQLLAVLDGSDSIVAGLPLIERRRRFGAVSASALPFTDLCRPLATDTAALEALSRALECQRTESGWARLSVCWPLELRDSVDGARGYRHVTPLDPDPDVVFRRFKKTQVQQRIRKAEKSGLEVCRADSWREMRRFYDLHVATRSRLGGLVEPLRFFRMIWDRLVVGGHGQLLLASKGGEIVSGALMLNTEHNVYYQCGASDAASWALRPNNLVLWRAVRWGCEHGRQAFHWGFSDGCNRGLRDFKRGWGSDEFEVHQTVVADRQESPSRVMPWLGTLILRLPPTFCRVSGELLYGPLQ